MAKFRTSISNIEIDFKDKYSSEFTDFKLIYDSSFQYHLIAVKNGIIKRSWIKIIVKNITDINKYNETIEAIYKSLN